MPSPRPIVELRGVRVRNLKGIDVDVPLGQLVAITGVSGAGKSSLAFDTLFAEGRRRYVETLPTSARGLLDPIARPEADSIGQIPPAIAVRQRFAETSWRPTVATAAELHPLLRLLYARGSRLVCPRCQIPIETHAPAQAALAIGRRPAGDRVQIAFPWRPETAPDRPASDWRAIRFQQLLQAGFVRAIVGDRTVLLSELAAKEHDAADLGEISIVVDRVTAGVEQSRLNDSLEQAYRHGHGVCQTFSALGGGKAESDPATTPAFGAAFRSSAASRVIDGLMWQVEQWSELLQCPGCGTLYPEADPLLFSFNQANSACATCHGLGRAAPAVGRSAKRARSSGGPAQRTPKQPKTAETKDSQFCPSCHGDRLRPEALAWLFAGRSIASLLKQPARQLLADWPAIWREAAHEPDGLLIQAGGAIERRLRLLDELGLGYLELDRPLRTLAAGEAQRVRLAGALATELVHMLYVLDEPAASLHPRDRDRLADALVRLRDEGNSVVIVEHAAELIGRCDHVIDLGPGAGRDGGSVLFAGPPDRLVGLAGSATGAWLARRAGPAEPRACRQPSGWLELAGVSLRNLNDVSVRFPLGVLCVVTGVSGSGKTTLVAEALAPLVRAAKSAGDASFEAGRSTMGTVTGTAQLQDVQLIETGPLGRSLRSTPATFLGLLGPIRQLFAATHEAQTRSFGAGHFSFHAASAGRCETCEGTGVVSMDMQFLPEIVADCPDCHGARFRKEVLEVRYRGLSIAEVLAQSAREALPFFRGQTRIQKKLKLLADVGLDALCLGQPAQSLSAGETQRLRLAECLTRIRGGNCLIVLDEPTRGLHPADVARLRSGFDHMLSAGHSLVVVEHQPDVIAAADWIIELGPGAGGEGGRVIAQGPPAAVMQRAESVIG